MPTVSVSLPKTLLHSTILQPLGSRGKGEVYLAEDTKLGRRVALKVLRAAAKTTPNASASSARPEPVPH